MFLIHHHQSSFSRDTFFHSDLLSAACIQQRHTVFFKSSVQLLTGSPALRLSAHGLYSTTFLPQCSCEISLLYALPIATSAC